MLWFKKNKYNFFNIIKSKIFFVGTTKLPTY